MMDVYFATSNDGKFNEVKEILKYLIPDIFLIQLKVDIVEIQGTPAEISIHKTEEIMKNYTHDMTVFTEDISLYCKGLHGLPGPYIKDTLKQVGVQNLSNLVELSGNTEAEAVAFYTLYQNNLYFTVSDSVIGNIVKPRGSNDFGFDSIFELPTGITFAEMELNEKNTVSHRRKALEKLSKLIVLKN